MLLRTIALAAPRPVSSRGTIAYVKTIISRPDRGTWPRRVLREAEYKVLLDEIVRGSTSWMIIGRGARRRPWRWSPTQGFLWESTDPPDPEIISQLASLRSAMLVVRFPDTSALQVDLRKRKWTVLAPQVASTAHYRAKRIRERLIPFDQWWRNTGLVAAVVLMLEAVAVGAFLIPVENRLIRVLAPLIPLFYAWLLLIAHDGLGIRDRFLPKRAPTFTVGPINITGVIGAVLLVVATVLITNALGKK